MMRNFVAGIVTLAVASACSRDVLGPTEAPAPDVPAVKVPTPIRPRALSLDATNMYRCSVVRLVNAAAEVYDESLVSVEPVGELAQRPDRRRVETSIEGLTKYHAIAFERVPHTKSMHRRALEVGCVIPSTPEAHDYVTSYLGGQVGRFGSGAVGGIPQASAWTSPLIYCIPIDDGDYLDCEGTFCTIFASQPSNATGVGIVPVTIPSTNFSYECTNGCVVTEVYYDCGGGGGGEVETGTGGGGGGGGGVDGPGQLEESLGGCREIEGASGPSGGGGTFNPAAFASHLRANAGSSSGGNCARALRQSLCVAGGVTGACDGYQHPICAKDYGPFLATLGFTAVTTGSGKSASGYPLGYTPTVGDIVVFAYDPYGHVAAWDGVRWTSDYLQPDIQPSPGSNPDRQYTIYRRSP